MNIPLNMKESIHQKQVVRSHMNLLMQSLTQGMYALIIAEVIFLILQLFHRAYRYCGIYILPYQICYLALGLAVVIFVVNVLAKIQTKTFETEKICEFLNRHRNDSIFQVWKKRLFIIVAAIILTREFVGDNAFKLDVDQMSLCNELIQIGSTKRLVEVEKSFIQTRLVNQINYVIESKIKNFPNEIYIIQGLPGIGKSQAIKYSINKCLTQGVSALNITHDKLLFFYVNIEGGERFKLLSTDIPIQSIFSVPQDMSARLKKYVTSYEIQFSYGFGKIKLGQKKAQNRFTQFLSQISKLAEDFYVFIIMDGVNKVKSHEQFIKTVEFMKVVQQKIGLKFHLILISSKSETRIFLDQQSTQIKPRYYQFRIFDNIEKQSMRVKFDEMISIQENKTSPLVLNKMRAGKDRIINLCYGFGELIHLFNNLIQSLELSPTHSLNRVINQIKQLTYMEKRGLVGNRTNILCKILNQQNAIASQFEISALRQQKILNSNREFYSKLIKESFRTGFRKQGCCVNITSLNQSKANNSSIIPNTGAPNQIKSASVINQENIAKNLTSEQIPVKQNSVNIDQNIKPAQIKPQTVQRQIKKPQPAPKIQQNIPKGAPQRPRTTPTRNSASQSQQL